MPTNKEIDKSLDKISKKISFFAINPVNEEAEKKKFFKDKKYQPVFEYEPYTHDIDKLQTQLRDVSPDNSELGKILKQARNIYYANLNMIKSRGKDNFTKYSILCYGAPDKDLVKEARKILKSKRPIKEKKDLTTAQVISRMKYAFIKYGFSWKIVEKEMAACAAVNGKKKELIIKKGQRFSKKFLKRLIVHEIGTHILRTENGAHQPYKIFERGLPNYLMTEEGLAVTNEEINHCLDIAILRRYAARVIAVDTALKKGFRKVYEELTKYLDKDLAWRTTVRVKRGLGDTSKPGGCTKDFAYLRGYFAVKRYTEAGNDLQKLYYGKVGIQHVEMLDKIPGLVEPELLPTFRYLRYFIEHFEGLLKSVILLDIPPFNLTFRLIKNNIKGLSLRKMFNGKK
ncbi:DUF1704 domain-containing protein [Candidatus Woesearchaeota archaeon]|jgi:uncharacterized protein (TIGR02421 family)|nr:DUF1704 domain-containing protein [Candidatus Woesearchaeota archaeon]MBT5272236.1 DUF1704 domain-containing protein [Candidatus Woesearchaeota archaeon]MBT6040532.1 DUF1704 domain-containing protein [Candidatus Woesearchaeota archaeon]MBT6336508.1 DUF1704 domain-containing protein [Candidatus Woesearchaeota archaeon]MBT7927398.1 DUF1704 domain-containing protein [Candidatus Woesearchaeota archaeon]